MLRFTTPDVLIVDDLGPRALVTDEPEWIVLQLEAIFAKRALRKSDKYTADSRQFW